MKVKKTFDQPNTSKEKLFLNQNILEKWINRNICVIVGIYAIFSYLEKIYVLIFLLKYYLMLRSIVDGKLYNHLKYEIKFLERPTISCCWCHLRVIFHLTSLCSNNYKNRGNYISICTHNKECKSKYTPHFQEKELKPMTNKVIILKVLQIM